MQTDMSLQIGLLGTPRIESEGRTVTFKRRKSLALVALAAVERKHHSRESIMALLWPDSDQSHASALLRTVLWEIRHTPLDSIMDTQGQQIGIPADVAVFIDASYFLALTEQGRIKLFDGPEVIPQSFFTSAKRAASLYRGSFLDGFSLPGSLEFEEWITYQRDIFQRRYISLLTELIHGYEVRGDFDTAIEYARRLLLIDEMDESVHRTLMKLYAKNGERSRAIAQYESCVSILRRELEIAPENETDTLFVTIRSGGLAESPSVPMDARIPFLPRPVTTFIGRNEELADYSRLILDPKCRLLTITGLGGSGKTRLAIELGRILSEQKNTRVAFVSLTPIQNADGILFAIADALSLSHIRPPNQSGSSQLLTQEYLLAALVIHLHAREMILILDNFEHLLEHAIIVDSILNSCSKMKIVITSREPTSIKGEWVREIRGLSCPTDIPGESDPFVFDSMCLFRELALRFRPEFSPDTDEIVAMMEICRMIDGIPLGIELAVPWLQTMTCRQMAKEIGSNVDFLERHHKGMPQRHESPRAIFDQTWTILEPEARSCFRKLSVFRGGFSADAARKVAGASVDALSFLAKRSLIRFNGRNRFEILEVIRQFAVERLQSVPREHDVITDRHARYFLNRVAEFQSKLKGSGQREALEWITGDLDNIRAAWKQAVIRGMIREINVSSFPLFLFFDISSRFVEGSAMFYEAIRVISAETLETPTRLIALLHAAHAWFQRYADIKSSEREFDGSLGLLDRERDRETRAFVLVLSTLHTTSVSREKRADRLSEGLEIYKLIGDLWGEALSLEGLSYIHARSDPSAAQSLILRSLSIRQTIRDQWGISLALFMHGYVLEFLGRNIDARNRYEESALVRRQLGQDLDGTLGCLLSMARIDLKEDSHKSCEQCLKSVQHTGIEHGLYLRAGDAMKYLIRLALIRDDPDRARVLSDELTDYISEYDLKQERGDILVLRGEIYDALGDSTAARDLFERALSRDPGSAGALLGLGMLERDTDTDLSYRRFLAALQCDETGMDNEYHLRAAVEMARYLVEYDQHREATYLLRYVILNPRRSRRIERYASRVLTGVEERFARVVEDSGFPRNEMLTLDRILSLIPPSLVSLETDGGLADVT